MSLPSLAKNASDRDVPPILFGLLADGSGEARFARTGAPFEPARASAEVSRYSPSHDWYGRWAVRPLHGILKQDATRMCRGVCPEDIVILGPRRRA